MPTEDFYKEITLVGSEEPEKPQEDIVPSKVGKYTIESYLNKGGMSVLYLGLHPKTKDPLAIKVLARKYISHKEVIDKFLKEASIIAATNHKNIVKLYGYGRWEGGLYIAMEFVRGVSLRQFIMQSSMSLKKALEALLEVAYALCHLHTHGVIHRDLKPENILLTEEGNIKIIDFGVAQLQPESDIPEDVKKEQETKKRVMGTPVYMSPEQREHPELVTYASDIYSIGIIAYELVLGRLSHGVIHLSLMPRRLQKILAKALQPSIKDRYQDIVDVIMDIKKYLKSTSISKDTVGKDQTEELKEHLQNAQRTLTPALPPTWDKIEVGLVSHPGLSVAGVYYDFFELPNNCFGIIVGESSTKGVESVIYSSILRGMIRSLSPESTNPTELVTKLNKLLVEDPIDQVFILSYLILDTIRSTMHYISCGYGNLWMIESGASKPKKITADNIGLGISEDAEFLEVTHNWNIGDSFIINTFGTIAAKEKKTKKSFGEEQLEKVITDNIYAPPQKQADAIFRRIGAVAKHALEERPLTIIGCKRKG